MKHQAGYTLLELLVVLTIMGILISAIPGMAIPGVASVRFSGRVQAITLRLSSAHAEAIETGRTTILDMSDLASPGVDVTVSDNKREIVFFPDGSASAAVLAVAASGHRRILQIEPVTGAVESR